MQPGPTIPVLLVQLAENTYPAGHVEPSPAAKHDPEPPPHAGCTQISPGAQVLPSHAIEASSEDGASAPVSAARTSASPCEAPSPVWTPPSPAAHPAAAQSSSALPSASTGASTPESRLDGTAASCSARSGVPQLPKAQHASVKPRIHPPAAIHPPSRRSNRPTDTNPRRRPTHSSWSEERPVGAYEYRVGVGPGVPVCAEPDRLVFSTRRDGQARGNRRRRRDDSAAAGAGRIPHRRHGRLIHVERQVPRRRRL